MTLQDNVAIATKPENGRESGRQSMGADAELVALLGKLKAAQRKAGPPDYDTRALHLDKLERTLLARKHDIAKAIATDFGNRSSHETLVAEVFITLNEIKHTRA